MPRVQSIGHQGENNRRRRRGPRLASSLSEINVIPLVDVMLVMLVIFMATAPMMQRGLDVSLPEARRADAINEERIFVTVPLSFRSDGTIQVGDDPVRLEVLHDRMAQDLEGRIDRNVFLRGDGGITYQELMSVIDQLKEGGVEEVGLVSDVARAR